MKQLTCEMCGSTELLKQDGVFVCQTCGTKYSVEEAKKMMVEGTVEVKGTVKIDHSDKIDNYYALAENAYDSSNFEEAETYCNKIIELDSTNYKAWFLKGKAVGWQSTLKEVRIEESIMCFSKALPLIPDDCGDEDADDVRESLKEEAKDVFEELVKALLDLCFDQFSKSPDEIHSDRLILNLDRTSKYVKIIKSELNLDDSFALLDMNLALKLGNSGLSGTTTIIEEFTKNVEYNDKNDFVDLKKRYDICLELQQIAITMYKKKLDILKNEHRRHLDECSDIDEDILEKLTFSFKNSEDRFASSYVVMCEGLITSLKNYNKLGYYDSVNNQAQYLTAEEKEINNKKIDHYYELIQEINPSYEINDESDTEEVHYKQFENKSGCYVATCVYGSYDCPQVWTLRRYRDDTLGSTWYGRLFIRTYYAISPTLVKWFGNTNWFKKMWKGKLDRMVAKLQNNGVEDTPYEDKEW